jgi:hypothetical protein
MGLALTAKDYIETLHIGYGGFAFFRKEIAKAYSEKHGKMYSDMISNFGKTITPEFIEEWNKDGNENLDILLWHSDCGGKLTPQESRKIYNELIKLTPKFEDPFYEEFFEDFKDLLQYCYKRRVMLYFY